MFDLKKEKYRNSNIQIEYSIIPWDSKYLKNTTIQIYEIKLINTPISLNDFELFYSSLRLKRNDLIFSKVDSSNNELIRMFNSLGFYFVEISLSSIINLHKFSNDPIIHNLLKDYVCLVARKKDKRFLFDVAKNSFKKDRFHLDINIDNTRAGKRYVNWVNNSFKNNENIYIFKDKKKKRLGFFIIKYINDNMADLRLIALDNKYKGKGLGKLMYLKMLQFLKSQGIMKVVSQISLNNITVINIYAQLNSKFMKPLVVLHKVINKNYE